MLDTVLIAGGASLVTSLVAYVLGVYKGKRTKLAELHELQEEGWLTITYRGDPSKRSDADTKALASTPGGVEKDERIQSLLHRDEPDEDGLVTRSRRDSEARRTDWAKHMKARGAETVDEEDS